MGFLDFINPISGILSGGMQMLANTQQNQAAMQRQVQAQQFNSAQQVQSEQYNAAQAQLGRDFSAEQSERAMAFGANQAAVNRNWQQMMSSTAFQRGVADMKAAGINPILAAGGGGASTPGGGMASGVATGGPSASVGALGGPGPAPTVGMMQGVLSSALEAARASPSMDLLRKQADTEEARANNITEDTLHYGHTNELVDQQTRKASADADTSEILRNVAKRDAAKADIERSELSSNLGRMLETGSIAGRQVQGALSSAGSLQQVLSPLSWLFGSRGGAQGPGLPQGWSWSK